MNIQKTNNVNFKCVLRVNPHDAKEPYIRPLIHYLKHHYGSKDTRAYLFFKEKFVSLSISHLLPGGRFCKPIETTFTPIAPIEKNVEMLLKWAKGTKSWLNKVKNGLPTE